MAHVIFFGIALVNISLDDVCIVIMDIRVLCDAPLDTY